MCQQCSARINIWNTPFEHFALGRATVNEHKSDENAMKAGQWCLVACNDPSFIFPVDPRPCPVDNFIIFDSDDFDAPDDFFTNELEKWEEDAEVFSNYLAKQPEYVNLVLAAKDIGFEATAERFNISAFGRWMFHYLGSIIEQNPEPLWRTYLDSGHDINNLPDMLVFAGINTDKYCIEYADNDFRIINRNPSTVVPGPIWGVPRMAIIENAIEAGFSQLAPGETHLAIGKTSYSGSEEDLSYVTYADNNGNEVTQTLFDYAKHIVEFANLK